MNIYDSVPELLNPAEFSGNQYYIQTCQQISRLITHTHIQKTQYTPDWRILKKFGRKVIQSSEETLTTHKHEATGNAVYASNDSLHRKCKKSY